MAINRRMNNRNLESRLDCFSVCDHLEDSGEFCVSGVYSCGSGPGGNCNCVNMGPVIQQYNQSSDLCQWSCGSFNAMNNYYSCLASCFSSSGPGGGTGGGTHGGFYTPLPGIPIGGGGRSGPGSGRSSRRGGPIRRRFQRGGNVRNKCPRGYTMIGGVCRDD